jgi:uncharacterized protein (TIGR02466 family)
MTECVVYPLFSCPLYVSNVYEDLNIDITLDKLHNESFENKNDGLGKLSTDNNILLNKKYIQEYNSIIKHLEKYIYEILCIKKSLKIEINQSWSVFHTKNNFASNHIHTNSSLSGVLYVKCDDNSGNIVFSMPATHPTYCTSTLCYHDDLTESNFLNSNEWWIQPKIGNIILFPSHVYHRIERSFSDNDRYSIAFNCVLRGSIGSSSYSSNLRI